jgi:hypothetical protein
MRLRGIGALLVLGVLMAFGACGGESEEDEARTIAEQYLAQDPEVCENVGDRILKAFFKGDPQECKQQAKEAVRVAGGKQPKVDVHDVSVDGETATVTASAGKLDGKVKLAKDDGDWKIVSLGNGTTAEAETETDPCEATAEGWRPGAANTGQSPVADCLDALQNYNWRRAKEKAKGVRVSKVSTNGDTSTVIAYLAPREAGGEPLGVGVVRGAGAPWTI